MIQFNLLPDVKLEFIRAQRIKRLVILVAVMAGSAALGGFLLLVFLVNVIQKTHINNLSDDIKTYSKQLQEKPEIDKVLTVQNQLNSLPALHDEKAVTSRLAGFIQQLTPAEASINRLSFNFAHNTGLISGSANSLETVNKFADTLKFTEFNTEDGQQTGRAFSTVVLTNFSRDSEDTMYELAFSFDPVIFDSASSVSLTVPQIISTRSETEKPDPLFQSLNTEGTNP